MRYVDWVSGSHPQILRKEDYEKMIQGDNLFARKFDPAIDNAIVELIYKKIE